METVALNKQLLIHYWSDFESNTIDFTLAQAHLYSAFPNFNIAFSPQNIKKGYVQSQAVHLQIFKDAFPAGTIHICHLAFESTQSKRFSVVKYLDQYFLGPDNGLFPLTFNDESLQYYILPVENFTFKALPEVYIPSVLSMIESDFDLEKIFKPKSIQIKLNMIQPTIVDNALRISAIHIDNFGNVYFNLSKDLFDEFGQGRKFQIIGQQLDIRNIHNDYDDRTESEVVAMFSYGNLLQIAMNAGSASRLLGLSIGTNLLVRFASQ